jgi:GNAT superfamily N-acetyltransferase
MWLNSLKLMNLMGCFHGYDRQKSKIINMPLKSCFFECSYKNIKCVLSKGLKRLVTFMSTPETIAEIEEVASRAWPAKHTKQFGGWLLRANEGVTRRANSVLPLQKPAAKTLEAAFQEVQQFYRLWNLPVRFQMTMASQPIDLDAFLESVGLTIDMRVNVLGAPLADIYLEEPEVGIVIFGSPWKDWYLAYARAAGFDKRTMVTRQEIIERISGEKACAAAIMDDQVVGVGLGVLEKEWLGLFSLVTEEPYRRRRVASSITQSLVSWGLSRGAKQGYLQVEQGNKPAQKLYYGLGFRDAYSYWYRAALH